MKPLIVGERNPFGGDPHYALYPRPRASSGNRLREMMGVSDAAYLRAFERVNLCTGKWSVRFARKEASRLIDESVQQLCREVVDGRVPLPYPNRPVVLLGSKVCEGFEVKFVPFAIMPPTRDHHVYVVLPHPSGLNRIWNTGGLRSRVRETLVTAGVLPVPEPRCLRCGGELAEYDYKELCGGCRCSNCGARKNVEGECSGCGADLDATRAAPPALARGM